MASSRPADVVEKFQTFGPPSNLDCCGRCGAPRSAHGPGDSCTTGVSTSVWVISLLIGGLLTGSGFMLLPTVSLMANNGRASLAMIAIFAGLTLLATGVILRNRSAAAARR